MTQEPYAAPAAEQPTKFCKFCGEIIPADAVVCTHCGRQVEELTRGQPNLVINNTNTNQNTNQNFWRT